MEQLNLSTVEITFNVVMLDDILDVVLDGLDLEDEFYEQLATQVSWGDAYHTLIHGTLVERVLYRTLAEVENPRQYVERVSGLINAIIAIRG
jgi:hypothetical protein